jgi:AhpC/TSA family
MMRVFSPAKVAPLSASLTSLAAAAVLFAGCSSAPIDEEPVGNEAEAGASSGPTPPPSPSGAPVTPEGDYKKRSYPAGPYGSGLGATLADHSFLGWHDPLAAGYDETKLEEVSLSEFYDPDGSKGIKLLWINASAVWCSVCRTEMKDIKNNGVRAEFEPKGVKMLVTLFEDSRSGPAKPLDLHNWGSAPAHSIDYPLVLDPGFKLGAFFTSDATPLNMLVDARTMKIVKATVGYSADYWKQVDALLDTLP